MALRNAINRLLNNSPNFITTRATQSVLRRPKGYPHSRASRSTRPEGSPLG